MLRFLVNALAILAFLSERPGDRVFSGHWQTFLRPVGTAFFTPLPGLRLPLWDLLLLAAFVAAYATPRALKNRARPLDSAMVGALGGVAFAWAWGVFRGGNAYQTFFQLHVFVFMLVLAWLFIAVLRTPRALDGMATTILVAGLVRAVLGGIFLYFVVKPRGIYPFPTYMTSHDDTVLFVMGVVISLSRALARPTARQILRTVAASTLLLFGILINQRRVAWLSLAVCVLMIYFLLPKGRVRRRIRNWVLVIAPLLALYVSVGWGRSERIFAPVRSFTTIVGDTEDESSKSRNVENDGLVFTLAMHPMLGMGFGHEYIETSTVYSAGLVSVFPQYRYIPHNALLGVFAFSGLVGFSFIWMVFPVHSFLAMRSYWAALTPAEKSTSMAAAVGTVAYLNQAYGDMGVQSLTASVIMAWCFAVSARLATRTGAWPARATRPGALAPADPPLRPATSAACQGTLP